MKIIYEKKIDETFKETLKNINISQIIEEDENHMKALNGLQESVMDMLYQHIKPNDEAGMIAIDWSNRVTLKTRAWNDINKNVADQTLWEILVSTLFHYEIKIISKETDSLKRISNLFKKDSKP